MIRVPPDVMKLLLVLLSSLLALASATVYFKDTFEDGGEYGQLKRAAVLHLVFLRDLRHRWHRVNVVKLRILVVCILDAWSDRWVQSTKRSDYGAFKLSAGKFYGDAEKDKG